jgi:hypothetical protein
MKKKIGDHITNYLIKHTGDENKIIEFATFVEKFFENVPEEYEDVHYDFYSEVENFTTEIDEDMINEVISTLRTKEGTVSGVKWTIEESKSVAKQYDVKNKIESYGKTFDCHRFWFALNYVYAVHYSLNRTINGYVDLAIDEYCNKNICFDTTIRKIFERI